MVFCTELHQFGISNYFKQKISWKKNKEMFRRNFLLEFNASQVFTVTDDDFDYRDIRHRILRASAYLGESQ